MIVIHTFLLAVAAVDEPALLPRRLQRVSGLLNIEHAAVEETLVFGEGVDGYGLQDTRTRSRWRLAHALPHHGNSRAHYVGSRAIVGLSLGLQRTLHSRHVT